MAKQDKYNDILGLVKESSKDQLDTTLAQLDLLKESRFWHDAAQSILKASNLNKQLSSYGDVFIGGSYELGLMMSADIDIYVVNDNFDWLKAQQVHQDLIGNKYFNLYTIANWYNTKYRLKKWQWLPKAYYLNLKTDAYGARWKLDIWLLTAKDYEKQKNDWVKKRLNKDLTKSILAIKKARYEKIIEPSVSGCSIYDAVINHKVNTVREFKEFIGKNNG